MWPHLKEITTKLQQFSFSKEISQTVSSDIEAAVWDQFLHFGKMKVILAGAPRGCCSDTPAPRAAGGVKQAECASVMIKKMIYAEQEEDKTLQKCHSSSESSCFIPFKYCNSIIVVATAAANDWSITAWAEDLLLIGWLQYFCNSFYYRTISCHSPSASHLLPECTADFRCVQVIGVNLIHCHVPEVFLRWWVPCDTLYCWKYPFTVDRMSTISNIIGKL